MNDNLKKAIDRLQLGIVPCYESDNVLCIFDNEAELLKYRRKNKYMCPNQLLITIEELYLTTRLDGMRYKRFHFMRNEEIDNA